MAITERRGTKRFPLKLTMSVRASGTPTAEEVLTECQDVSSHGVFFFLQEALQSGSPLDIVLTLPFEITHAEPVRVRCEARVQRAEPAGEGRVGIAASIERYRFLAGKRERRRAS